MRGKDAIYEFLRAHRPLSEAQEYLPHGEVLRAEIVNVCIELNEKLDKANEQLAVAKEKLARKQGGESSSAATMEQAIGASASTGGEDAPEARATAEIPVPIAPGSEENMSEPPQQKPKLCKVNWGKSPCPATEDGSQCAFVHLDLCTRPQCLIRENRGDCTLWHGHLRGMLQREKAIKRREAEQKAKERADKADRQEYERWQARRKQTKPEQSQPGNGNGRGKRSNPHQPYNAPKAQSAQGQSKFQGKRGHPPSRGDFLPQEEFPPLQRSGNRNPQSVWETTPNNAMEQFHQVYQMFQQFQKFLNAGAMQQQPLQQGAF